MAGSNGTGARRTPVRNTTNSPQRNRRRRSPRRGGLRRYWIVLFWLAFVIIIYGFFLFNREAISNSIEIIQSERIAQQLERENIPAPPLAAPPPAPLVQVTPVPPPAQAPLPVVPLPVQQAPAPQPPVHSPPAPIPETAAPPLAMLPAPVPPPPVQPPPQQVLQERSLYFTQIDRAGMIFRSRVNRRLPASDTPMTDVLRSLMEGPNEDEIRRGLFTLIPPGTQIISATVQGGTAHINFNENFRYNTYGVEGYIGQLRQIIYTVTEFPAVTDVQILIEGRPVDFLGEGIWIGSPIRRGQF